MREESALNMFRQMDLKGKAKDDTQLKTVHQNTISTLRSYDESGGNVKKFSSKRCPLLIRATECITDTLQPAVWMAELLCGPLNDRDAYPAKNVMSIRRQI